MRARGIVAALAALLLVPIVVTVLLWTPPGPASAGETGCNPARPHAAGDFDETIDSGGFTREYLVHVPASYTGADAVPLVLNFHGAGGSADEQADYSGLPAKADEAGFILVTPQGTETTFLPDRHWNFTTLEQFVDPDTPDDVAFVAGLLDALESQFCIDAVRVFSTGFSNGAFMTSRLACNLSGRIAAIAPVAGVYFPPWSPDLTIEPGCLSTRPVPVVAFHGTADSCVPFEGGEICGPPGDLSFRLRHVEDEIMPDWAEHNGCDSVPMEEPVDEGVRFVRLVRYQNCDQEATVELYVIIGGGHQWPGAEDFPDPDVADQISANDLMWDFFTAHPFVVVPGDVNCDASVNSIDAAIVLQFDAGLIASPSCHLNADTNEDGSINSIDAALILQFTAGLIDTLPPA